MKLKETKVSEYNHTIQELLKLVMISPPKVLKEILARLMNKFEEDIADYNNDIDLSGNTTPTDDNEG
jgi:hypothetical protein